MPIPSHGYNCITIYNYETTCTNCKKRIIYFECSCRSKVFFNSRVDWEKHDCVSALQKESYLSIELYQLTKNFCEKTIRKFQNNDETNLRRSEKVRCRICFNLVRAVNIKKHLRKPHSILD